MKPGNLIVALFLTLLATIRAFSQSTPAPLSRSEILGRLALGLPPSSIAHLIKTQGIAFSVSSQFLLDVERAGGRGILLEKLSNSESKNRTATPAKPEQNSEHFANCAALLHIGNTKEAIPECRASIDEIPQSPWPLLVTAQVLADTNPEDQEVQDLARRAMTASSIPVGSEFGDAALNNARAHIIGLPAGAPASMTQISPNAEDPLSPALKRMLVDLPDLSSTHFFAAEVFVQARMFDKCTDEINEVLRLDPDHAGIHFTIARLYELEENFEAQLTELRESVRIMPYDFDLRAELARALENQDRTGEGIAEWRDLLDKVPDSALAKNELARIYATAAEPRYRNPGEALTLATEAAQLSDDSSPVILDTLAEALLINGLPDQALETERKALQLDPYNWLINDRITRFQEAARQTSSPVPQ
jgi:tetratricopeptide (TPR) repeat protein